jgi:hypothetical protein
MKKFILNKQKLITFWSPVHYFLETLSLLFGEASFIKKIRVHYFSATFPLLFGNAFEDNSVRINNLFFATVT